MSTATQYQFAIRDIVNSIVDEYARKHKPGAGQLGLFENPAERPKPLFSKRVDDEAGRWVTMRGARVFISGEDGRIMKGPKALMGKTKEQIERESAGKEGGGDRKPKPKPLNEMGKISGGRKENRQQKLFEELNPGFTFVDDGDEDGEEEDFKVVEPVNFEEALKSDFEQAISEVPSSPAEKENPVDGEWMTYKGIPFKVAHSFEDRKTGITIVVPSYETFKTHGRVPSEMALGEVQKLDKDEEPSFTLDSTPQPSPAKTPAFGNPDATPSTKQGALFDTGKNTKDLKGQELLFNSDAGDLNNPKTMENRVKQSAKEDDGPNDGDTNAEGLVFRDGRWHRDEEEGQPEAKEKTDPLDKFRDPRDKSFEKLISLKSAKNMGDGIYYFDDSAMTAQRRNSLKTESEKQRLTGRIDSTKLFEFKTWAEVTGDFGAKGYAILDRRQRVLDRELRTEKTAEQKPESPSPSPAVNPHDSLLEQAAKFRKYGQDYNRNIATSANRLEEARSKGHGESMLNHLADELKLRLDSLKQDDGPLEAIYKAYGDKFEGEHGKQPKKDRYSRIQAISQEMNQIMDRYIEPEADLIQIDHYAHPLIHAAVGAGAMYLANKAFRGPMRSVAHMAIAAAMSAWMQSAMAAHGIPPAHNQASSSAVSSPAMTPFQKEKSANNSFDSIVQNAIAKHEQRSKAAENAPPSAAQLAADAVVGDAVNGGNSAPQETAGKEGAREVRPLKDRPDSKGASGGGSFNGDHPRHPAGSPQSKGGEFAPKGGEESGGQSGGSSAPEASSSPAESSSESFSESPRNYPDNLNKPASEQTNYSPPERAIEPTDSAKPTEPQKSPEQLYQEHLAKIAASKVDPGDNRQRPDRRAAWEQTQKSMAEQILADKQSKKDEAKKVREIQKAVEFNPEKLEAESSKMADENEFDVPKPKEEDFQTKKSLDKMKRWRAQRPTGSGPGYEAEVAKWKSEQPSFENAMKEWNRKHGASKASITKATNKNILSDIALENDLDHETLSNAVQDELKMVLPAHQRQEEARQYVSEMGWNAARINRADEADKDHSTTNLDENASEWAGLFPEIAGTDESEWVAKMWDLSKKGKQDPPSASDEDFVRSVAKRLVDQGYASSFSAGEESSNGDDENDEDYQPVHGQVGDVDYTPFSRAAVVGLIVDKYMRMAGIC